ncbi:hypothetical protein HK102_002688 [Quaeritorhiza haematococci]|nr:hypothetical protein HK102_002688 [Quaeritorhiza haematococci]
MESERESKRTVINTAEEELYREAFSMFDKDGNGTIEKPELELAIQSMGLDVSEDEIQKMIANVDADKSGAVDLEEFVAMMVALNPFHFGANSNRSLSLFQPYGQDKSHKSRRKSGDTYRGNAEYITGILGKGGIGETEESLREAFSAMDVDRNGYISVADMRTVMEGLGQQSSSEELMEMIRDADADCDGQVGFDDFVKMMLDG